MQQAENRYEYFGHHAFADPAEAQARKCYAQLSRRKIHIQVIDDMLGHPGDIAARLPPQLNLGKAHLDNGEFRSNKKCIEKNKQDGQQYVECYHLVSCLIQLGFLLSISI